MGQLLTQNAYKWVTFTNKCAFIKRRKLMTHKMSQVDKDLSLGSEKELGNWKHVKTRLLS